MSQKNSDWLRSCLSGWLSVRLSTKTASVIGTKVGRDIFHGRRLECIDREVKRSKVKGQGHGL